MNDTEKLGKENILHFREAAIIVDVRLYHCTIGMQNMVKYCNTVSDKHEHDFAFLFTGCGPIGLLAVGISKCMGAVKM